MSAGWSGIARRSITRRNLAKQIGGALLAAVAARSGAARILHTDEATPPPAPVVSFFLDQPYLDMTGLGEPYRPPRGLRSGQPLAALSEEAFRGMTPYL